MPESIVRIGILHSRSGTMAVAEEPMIHSALAAVRQINQAGGIGGSLQIEAIVRDGESDPDRFRDEAIHLIQQEKVAAIFGCWTSASRKAVKPVVEEFENLLWYPVQYEGLEESPSIVYTGTTLNQQVDPLLEWTFQNGFKRYYIVGSDYIFPRVAGKLIRSQIDFFGGQVTGESYHPLGQKSFSTVITKILESKPDAIINTINGDSNYFFYDELLKNRVNANNLPVFALSLSETETEIWPDLFQGHYAIWSYLSSDPSPANRAFKDSMLRDKRMQRLYFSDPVVNAYSQIFLWKQAVEKAGSHEPARVASSIPGLQWEGPSGSWRFHNNHHSDHMAFLGRCNSNGELIEVYRSPTPLEPKPWPGFIESKSWSDSFIKTIMSEYPDMVHLRNRFEIKTEELMAKELTTLHQNRQFRSEVEKQKEVKTKIQKKLQTLFNIMRDPTIVFSISGINRGLLLEKNQAFLDLFYPDQIVPELADFQSLIPFNGEGVFSEIVDGIGEGKNHFLQIQLVRKDGSTFPAEISSSLFEEIQDERIGIASIRDITERIRQQKEADERNALLVQQNKMAGLGVMIGALAHQWKQPLSILSLRIADLEEAKEANELDDIYLSDFVEQSEKLVRNMSQTIEDFRNFFVPSRHQKDFSALSGIKNILTLLQPRFKNRNIRVGLDTDLDESILTPGSVNEFQQVILNLISNSIDAFEALDKMENFREIKIDCRKSGDGNLVVQICDNGGGIDPAIKETLFSPFITTRGEAGTGIGLYIARLIIEERLNGSIRVENLNGGACFSISLPCLPPSQ